MKRMRLILCVLLIAVLAGGVVYANYADGAEDPEMVAEWEGLIDQAETARLFGPESVLEDTTQVVETSEEAAEIYHEYAESLDDIFTEGYKEKVLDVQSTYIDEVETREEINIEMREEIVDDKYFFEVLDYGHFKIEVQSYTQDGDTATVYVLVSIWEKTVELTENSEYLVMFPVNKRIEKVEMTLVEGKWKYSGSTIVSSSLMAADYDLEQCFKTYEEAVAYAHATDATDVLADEYVEVAEWMNEN